MKRAKTDDVINKFTVIVFVAQLLLALLLGVQGTAGRVDRDGWYLFKHLESSSIAWLVIPLRFLLLNSMMVPISLKVRRYTYLHIGTPAHSPCHVTFALQL